MYLYFVSLRDTDMTQVVDSFAHKRQGQFTLHNHCNQVHQHTWYGLD